MKKKTTVGLLGLAAAGAGAAGGWAAPPRSKNARPRIHLVYYKPPPAASKKALQNGPGRPRAGSACGGGRRLGRPGQLSL